MNTTLTPRATGAVTTRVLTQLKRDHRTLAMLLVLPCLLMSLLWWMFDELPGEGFSALGPALLALIPFIIMFLVTSVTTLRERTSGTLERLLAMPMGKLDFLLGYAIAFGLVAAVQSALAVGVCVWLLDLTIVGVVWMLMVVAVMDALLGTALGLFISAFARTEFQAVQFMPAVVIPQILLCGLFVPRASCRPCWRRSPTCCRCPTRSTRCRPSPARRRPVRCGRTSRSSRRSSSQGWRSVR